MTALVMGLFIGSCLTWFVYWLVHKGKINGLNATISSLTGTKNVLEERIKQKDEDIQKLRVTITTSPPDQNKSDTNAPVLKFEPFTRADTRNKQTSIVGLKVTNNSDKWLQHCSIRIENIQPPGAVFSDSKLKGPLPKEKPFSLAALDHRDVLIAQFDSISGGFLNLGIELLCFSTQEYPALDFEKSYTLTIVSVTEVGPPTKRDYRLWVEGGLSNQKLHFEEA